MIKFNSLLILLIICLIHYCFINGFEKILFQLSFKLNNSILRPNNECKYIRNIPTYCLGLPSGHVEITTIICYILYELNYISMSDMQMMIFLMCFQRMASKKHTPLQVLSGCLFGLFYAKIYLKFELSSYVVYIALFIVFMYANIIIGKIDILLNNPIPIWVDKNMIKYIEKKKNVDYSVKLISILSAPIRQDVFLYMDWNDLEYYLDKVISNIQNTKIKFDGIVGIKTGGAIISDYVSNKLNITNYKIKVSNKTYKCNKKSSDFFKNYIDTYILKNNQEFEICEQIDDNLENKNIILIDENVSSGKTMNTCIQYLIDKKVNVIYPIAILSNDNIKLINNYNLTTILIHKNNNPVWAWGYDN
jgi:hypoxanthine phosphoribosyltransferase